MQKLFALALGTLIAAPLLAQDGPPPQTPAPIEHRYHQQPQQPAPATQPAPGIWLRTAPGASVQTLSATADKVELSVTKGLANVTVHQPAENSEVLVDLPGGQTAILKDGLYTFNADTNMVRVVRGEADAFPGSAANSKAISLKVDHALAFGGSNRPVEFQPFQARADLLAPAGNPEPGTGYGYARGYQNYGYYGPYGDGFYPGSYYAWGYPYGYWGEPWGWGYPGFGLGFGFYGGGFYGGGFRGGGFRR